MVPCFEVQAARQKGLGGTAARSDVITAQTQLASVRASAIAVGQLRGPIRARHRAFDRPVARGTDDPTLRPSASGPEYPSLGAVRTARAPPRHRRSRTQDAAAECADRRRRCRLLSTVNLSAIAGYSGTPPLVSVTNLIWSLAASGNLIKALGGGWDRSWLQAADSQ